MMYSKIKTKVAGTKVARIVQIVEGVNIITLD